METVTGACCMILEQGFSASSGIMLRFSRTVFVVVLLAGAAPLVTRVTAQELNCSVSVDYRNLTGNDFTFLDEFSQNVREYVNNQIWTDDFFEPFERIDCTLQVIFTEAISLTRFRARLILASRRPIYATSQQTTIIQFSDENWIFEYARGTPLVYEPERFHPITSVLNFYANLILGYDYDSFSSTGGTIYFERARRISELAQSSGSVGWAQITGERSRGELIAQILDPRFRDLRRAYFDYHFTGLDHFLQNTDEARRVILDVVVRLEDLYDDVSRAYYLDQFFTAKYKEMAAVFGGSSIASQAYDALTRIDPAHLSDYSAMLQ